MSTFNKDTLRGFLYCLHIQRKTAKSAYAELLNATGQEVFCLEYVQELFKKIEDGEYDMKYEDPKLELSNMPEHINDMIIGNLDLKSRLIFRTISTQFRDLVDNSQLHIDKFTIRMHEYYNELICDDHFRMRYYSLEEFRHGLNVIFQNKKMTIKKMNVTSPRNSSELETFWWVNSDILDVVTSVLSSLKHHVKVETLSMVRKNYIGELMDVLPFLDSQTVKNVSINMENEEEKESFELEDEMFEMEQWKNIESFKSNHLFEDEKFVQRFSHISNLKIRIINKPSIEQVMQMKEILLKNPKVQQIKIEAKMKKKDFIKINRELQTFNVAGMANPSWAHFRYPNSSNKRLSLCLTNTTIWFKGPCYVEDEPEEVEPVYSDEEDDDDEGEDVEREDSDDNDEIDDDADDENNHENEQD